MGAIGPRRIVCLTEEPTEVLYALGEQDRAQRRPRIERRRRDGHGGAIGFAGGERFVEQRVEGRQRLGIQVSHTIVRSRQGHVGRIVAR